MNIVHNNITKMYLVGDLHFGVRSNSMEWLEIQKSFWTEFFIKKLDATRNKDTEILFLMGDIFHSREFLNIKVLNDVQNIFKKLSKEFKEIIIIVGNHDMVLLSKTTPNSIKQLELLSDNIKVIEDPSKLTINGNSFFMMPYEQDYTKFEDIVNKESIGCDYMLCHADILNMKFNKTQNIDHGLDIKKIRPFTKIYSGHIHHRQEKGLVLYTGTPYSMERTDTGNTKGWYELNFTNDIFTDVFIENTYSPIFIKLNILDLLNYTVNDIIKVFNNNYIDVYIESKYSGKFSISQFLDLIKESNIRKIDFFPYDGEKLKQINESLNETDGVTLTTEDAVKKFIEFKELDEDLGNVITKFFNKLLLEAKEVDSKLNMEE